MQLSHLMCGGQTYIESIESGQQVCLECLLSQTCASFKAKQPVVCLFACETYLIY